jgi:hypothetical protein
MAELVDLEENSVIRIATIRGLTQLLGSEAILGFLQQKHRICKSES